MKRHFYWLMLAALLGTGLCACKSKQQVVSIPNAHAEAVSAPAETPAPQSVPQSEAVPTPQPMPAPQPAAQPEEVRDEVFELDPAETNTQVMTQKYHVVVGSFKNRDNAKGLQQTLNTEGNAAVIVLNEHGMYRVLIASFPEYQQARAKINTIKDRFPDAWVLVQKEQTPAN